MAKFEVGQQYRFSPKGVYNLTFEVLSKTDDGSYKCITLTFEATGATPTPTEIAVPGKTWTFTPTSYIEEISTSLKAEEVMAEIKELLS